MFVLQNISHHFLAKTPTRALRLFLVFSVSGISSALAQNSTEHQFGNNFLFEMLLTSKRSMVTEPTYISASDTAIYTFFDEVKSARYQYARPKSPIILGVKLNPLLTEYFSASVQSVSKEYQTFIISDSSDATLVALGINSGNINDFTYRVVENDSLEIIPWSLIPKLEQRYGARKPYGFIGKYNTPGKRLMIEVVNNKNYSVREGVIFDWRQSFRPILSQVIINTPRDYFNLSYKKLNHGFATRFDRNGVPLDLKFLSDSIVSITVQLKKQETLVHACHLIKNTNGKQDTLSRIGFVDQYGYFRLDRSYFSEPGHYELVIQKQERIPEWNNAEMLRITFEVLPQKISWKNWIGYSVFVSVLFPVYWLYNRQKLNKARRTQATIQLKLKALRSQLNPHFMFNALSSIQNLMNKNALLEANHYLAKFARLTRKALDTAGQEMINLQEELKIAEDYLQMEQLRFGFEYKIDIRNENIDQVNTDVPAMILQPFIENAVKHGIAGMQDKGLITISVDRNGQDLVLMVKDNGKGFDPMSPQDKSSFGLKLSRERMDLLNEVSKNRSARLIIDSRRGNTVITITFTNWI